MMNMKRYYFYDYDEVTETEHDIRDDNYRKLIDFCCANAKTVSFMFRSADIFCADWLECFRIDHPAEITCSYYHLGMGKKREEDLGLRFYAMCPELHRWMLDSAESIFEWLDGWGYKNPENPIFYRSDGSVLLYSVIHDGEIVLCVRDDEDVSGILSSSPWKTEKRIY